jgi:Integrase core domain
MALPAPGKSMQTAFIESLNDRLRNELMNETPFTLLAQARVALGCWRGNHNASRPRSQVGWKTPSEPFPLPNRSNATDRANSKLDKTWGNVIGLRTFDSLVVRLIGAFVAGRETVCGDLWIFVSPAGANGGLGISNLEL